MVQKPKIQYVGQFYVYGSEARQMALAKEKQQARVKRPLAKFQQVEHIYVDPVAVVSIAVAVILLVTMILGTVQIYQDWEMYQQVEGYLSYLNKSNAQLEETYRSGYDLEDIENKALAMGLVPVEELEKRTITVTVPEKEPEVSRIQQWRETLENLFA